MDASEATRSFMHNCQIARCTTVCRRRKARAHKEVAFGRVCGTYQHT